MTEEIAWTGDRVAAVAAGAALLVLLYVFFFGRRKAMTAAATGPGGQEITIVVEGGYAPDVIVARLGLPLKVVFDRREASPCSDEIVIPDFGVRRRLPAHARTVIDILPDRTGDFAFTCGMNMLHGTIRVVP